MICPVCRTIATVENIYSADRMAVRRLLTDNKPLPTYALHIKCVNGNGSNFPSICAGHVTPPGLEELDKWAIK